MEESLLKGREKSPQHLPNKWSVKLNMTGCCSFEWVCILEMIRLLIQLMYRSTADEEFGMDFVDDTFSVLHGRKPFKEGKRAGCLIYNYYGLKLIRAGFYFVFGKCAFRRWSCS